MMEICAIELSVPSILWVETAEQPFNCQNKINGSADQDQRF